MKMIVTGITSFLGRNTARQLKRDGCEVYGIARPKQPPCAMITAEQLGVDGVIALDFDDSPNPESPRFSGYLQNNLPQSVKHSDCWIHFAWDGIGSEGRSNSQIQRRNIENTKKAYHIARQLGCRLFVFAGSQAEYGSGDHETPEPISEYGKAKLQVGAWARKEAVTGGDPAFLHLRIFSVYGPGDHKTSLVNTCIQALVHGEEFKVGPCTQKWNYLYIQDCARAICMLSRQRPEMAYSTVDIASAEGKTLREYVEIISALCGKKGRVLFGARGNNAEGAADLLPDAEALRKRGFAEAYTFEEGVRETILSITGGTKTWE